MERQTLMDAKIELLDVLIRARNVLHVKLAPLIECSPLAHELNLVQLPGNMGWSREFGSRLTRVADKLALWHISNFAFSQINRFSLKQGLHFMFFVKQDPDLKSAIDQLNDLIKLRLWPLPKEIDMKVVEGEGTWTYQGHLKISFTLCKTGWWITKVSYRELEHLVIQHVAEHGLNLCQTPQLTSLPRLLDQLSREFWLNKWQEWMSREGLAVTLDTSKDGLIERVLGLVNLDQGITVDSNLEVTIRLEDKEMVIDAEQVRVFGKPFDDSKKNEDNLVLYCLERLESMAADLLEENLIKTGLCPKPLNPCINAYQMRSWECSEYGILYHHRGLVYFTPSALTDKVLLEEKVFQFPSELPFIIQYCRKFTELVSIEECFKEHIDLRGNKLLIEPTKERPVIAPGEAFFIKTKVPFVFIGVTPIGSAITRYTAYLVDDQRLIQAEYSFIDLAQLTPNSILNFIASSILPKVSESFVQVHHDQDTYSTKYLIQDIPRLSLVQSIIVKAILSPETFFIKWQSTIEYYENDILHSIDSIVFEELKSMYDWICSRVSLLNNYQQALCMLEHDPKLLTPDESTSYKSLHLDLNSMELDLIYEHDSLSFSPISIVSKLENGNGIIPCQSLYLQLESSKKSLP